MIEFLKYKIRRIAQKVTGLDADNAEFSAIKQRVLDLEVKLHEMQGDYFYNLARMPDAVDVFKAPSNFFTQNIGLVDLLHQLGVIDNESSVVEFMCGAGQNSYALNGRIRNYLGLDSSEILIRFAKSKIIDVGFQFELISHQKLSDSSFDIAIIAGQQGRWSKLSTEHFIEVSKRCVKPNGIIVVQLPYPEVLPDMKELRFEEYKLLDAKFILARNVNSYLKVSNLN